MPPPCHTQQMIDGLPPEAQAVVTRALATERVPTTEIVKVLTAHGLPARAENVGRHRRRILGRNYACKCPLTSEGVDL